MRLVHEDGSCRRRFVSPDASAIQLWDVKITRKLEPRKCQSARQLWASRRGILTGGRLPLFLIDIPQREFAMVENV